MKIRGVLSSLLISSSLTLSCATTDKDFIEYPMIPKISEQKKKIGDDILYPQRNVPTSFPLLHPGINGIDFYKKQGTA